MGALIYNHTTSFGFGASDGPATLLLDLPKRKSPETKGLFLFKLVEAAGIEPASGNLPTEHLHT
jgi:hypothetical protein